MLNVANTITLLRFALVAWTQIAAITTVFFVLEIPLAWLSHRWGLRDQPF